ncbi:MAG TPA: hypothetical protein VKB31_10480 [Trueperaceae bacterium]|nr:hypothetical protein [Trueperaceae bacterium]
MTVDDWVYDAVESSGTKGATLRDVQRYIDERHFEELAVDTIESSLASLVDQGKLAREGTRYSVAHKTTKEDALKKLFGDS